MLNQSVVAKALQRICQLYRAKYGESISQLNEYCFDYTLISRDEKLATLIENNFSESEQRTHGESFELVFQELRAQKNIIEHPDGSYSLTKEGYLKGSSNLSKKSLFFLNQNPGIRVAIAIFAIIVTILLWYFGASET